MPVAGSACRGGDHNATSCGATSHPATTVSNGSSPPSGRQTMPGGEPKARAAAPESSCAIHGPGHENVRGSGTGISPSPRVASHPRHGVHGSAPSDGTGTSAASTSRIAARHAANDRTSGGPSGGMASGMRTRPGCLSRRARGSPRRLRHRRLHRRRAVRVEALHRLHAPCLALAPLGLGPDRRRVLGVVDEVAAGRDLDAVAARLDAVEEEALRDRVLARRGLDPDAGVEEQVRGAQALLARVDPEGDVVQARVRPVGVLRVDELVRGDRRAEPRARLGAVVELDALVQPVAEDVGREHAVGPHVGRQDVDVIEALHRGAAARVALRLVLQRRAQVVGRPIPVDVVVELERVAVGPGEAVAPPPPAVGVVEPRPPEPGRPDGGDAAVERLRARRAQPEQRHAGRLGLRELQAVALVVAPPAQVHRLALAAFDLHPEHLDEEALAVVAVRREQLDRPEVGDVAHDTAPSTFSRSPSRSYDSSPPASFSAFTRSFSSRSRAAASTSSTRSAAITATPSVTRMTTSPGLIVAPPTSTGTSSSPAVFLTAPWMRTQRAQVGGPSAASSSTSRTEASTSTAAAPRARACVASSPPNTAYGPGSGIVSTSTSPGCSDAIAAWTMRLSPFAHRTVRAGPAAREPGTIWCRSRSTNSPRPPPSYTVALPRRASSWYASALTGRPPPAG